MRLPRPSAIRAALRDPKRWRQWAIEGLIIVMIIVAVSLWQNRGLPEGIAPPIEGTRTDGVHVAKFSAGATTASDPTAANVGKPSLVVFWATWCPICKAEAGNVDAIAGHWPVLSVAMQSGDAAALQKHLTANGLKIPAIVDDDGDIASDWHVRSVPAHFIVDGSGNIRFRVVGYATELGLRLRLWWAEQFP